MTTSKTNRPPDNCPLCFMQSNIHEPIIMLGSKNFPHCAKGHEYPEREDLSNLSMQAFPKPTPVPLPPPSRSPQPVQPLDSSGGTKLVGVPGPKGASGGGNDQIGPGDPESPAPQSVPGMVIDEINFARISGILGHFTDASSLFGSIFALQQELQDTKELQQRAEASKKLLEGPRRLNGDAMIQLIIPERHVESVKGVAEANAMDETRFMNSVVELGLDNGWFFAIIVAIGGSFLWQLAQGVSAII